MPMTRGHPWVASLFLLNLILPRHCDEGAMESAKD